MTPRQKILISAGSAILVAGILIGILATSICDFTFENEVNVSDVLELIVTIIVALLIGFFLQKKTDAARQEKQLVIEELLGVRKAIEETHTVMTMVFRQGITPAGQNRDRLIEGGSRISQLLSAAENLMKYCAIESRHLAPLKKERHQYKKHLTGSPFDSSPYSHSTYHQATAVSQRMLNLIRQIIIDVNRS